MKIFFIILLICINQFVAFSQPLTTSQIDDLVERTLKAFDVPGIAVGLIKDGKVLLAKGYGVRSLRTKEKVDENTLFGIASNSKAFTTAALGMLIDEGKIKWDDKVIKYIPEFRLYDPWVTKEFTIRDLLTHRSGMGLGAGDLMIFPDSSNFELKDIIYNLRFLKPVSSFRTKYDYDNMLYIVAGEVIARVSKQSWDDFIEQRIMKPLGMIHSAASYDRLKDKSNIIDGHAPVDGKVQVIQREFLKIGHSAGGINSSVHDLIPWVMMQMNHGKYGDDLKKQLFSDVVHEEMWSPQTIQPTPAPGDYNTHFSAYGLGFNLRDVKGYKQVSHTGGLGGMVTKITMIPEINLGIIVLTNQQEGGAFQAITDQIKDGYLGVNGKDRVTEYATARNQDLAAAKKITDSVWNEIRIVQNQSTGKVDLNRYSGTYHDEWFGDVIISIKNGGLWFDAKRSPKLTGEVLAYKDRVFIVKWRDRGFDADCFMNFDVTPAGKISGFKMKWVSPLTDFSYDFQDLDLRKVKV